MFNFSLKTYLYLSIEIISTFVIKIYSNNGVANAHPDITFSQRIYHKNYIISMLLHMHT